MEAHSAASLFPLMEDADFSALCIDIREHGQREPIVIFDGKILDGRNRLAACEKIGVKPITVKCSKEDIGDPIAYVMSANMRRRHLSESQRAMIGLEVEKLYAAAARERQRDAGRTKLPAPVPEAKGEAREQAAVVAGVGSRSISSAKRVVEDGATQVADAVRNGKVTVKVAEQLVRSVADKREQAAIVREAVKAEKPDRAIKDAIAPKNPPPQYILSDQVLDITEKFVVMVQSIYSEHGGLDGLFANKHWDNKQTTYFCQHLHGLPGLLAKLRKDAESHGK